MAASSIHMVSRHSSCAARCSATVGAVMLLILLARVHKLDFKLDPASGRCDVGEETMERGSIGLTMLAERHHSPKKRAH
eukprot:5263329-Amphidinium_carterae.1